MTFGYYFSPCGARMAIGWNELKIFSYILWGNEV
jgi:hypothetical protein